MRASGEFDTPFLRAELDRAITMARRDSAPGLDGVEYKMLRLLPDSGREKVRPISLSSCVGKLMERLINERLMWWAENEDKFSKSQSGFRRAFLDVSAAYDCVNYWIMMDKLVALQCPVNIARFISKWLYCRRGLCAELPEGVKAVEFADDIGLYVSGISRRKNRELLERAVNVIAERLMLIGLALEPKKTVLVEFSRSGYVDRNLFINIQGTKVYNSGEAKFLGIWLDSGLTFHRQTQEIRGKSLVRSVIDYGIFVYFPRDASYTLKLERAQFMGIRTALGYRNSTPNNVIVAEAKVSRSLRDRAFMLESNFINKAMVYNQNGLCQKLQRAFDCESYARFLLPTYRFSLLSEVWRSSLKRRDWLGPSRRYEVFQGNYDAHTFVPLVDFDIGLKRKYKKFSDEILIREVTSQYNLESPEVVFTDGSQDENKRSTGASLIICDQEIAYKISLPFMCSSYTAEAFAVMAALRLLLCQIERRAKDMIVLSDCKSVLMSIRSNILDVYRNQYVIEARRILFELCYKHERRVVLVWIPAHKGILGNELADALAKEASTEEADPTIVVPLSDMMSSIRKVTWETTQNSIMAESAYKGAFYFSNFYERRATKPWFSKLDKERYFITWINRVRANHFNLGSSLKRKGYVDNERCDYLYEVGRTTSTYRTFINWNRLVVVWWSLVV
ncbi:uncharacterized protein LOC112462567 isoform X2 [Temnothorax curvispinosus]|uniref:Uncharacterized protein LOC112462567 isoform X2 n=1 Tax=Temnothorax curvispinosus TaxID=300111 RepID=A0A6J1QU96_9HYME|nr:uncharacterized protein LOC112462567 isoform X2 [Temnothorax curvispinosus]